MNPLASKMTPRPPSAPRPSRSAWSAGTSVPPLPPVAPAFQPLSLAASCRGAGHPVVHSPRSQLHPESPARSPVAGDACPAAKYECLWRTPIVSYSFECWYLLAATRPSPRHARGTAATAEASDPPRPWRRLAGAGRPGVVVRATWRTGAVARPIMQAARDDDAAAAHQEPGCGHDGAIKVTSMNGGQ